MQEQSDGNDMQRLAFEGAEKVVKTCLGLKEADELLIVADETTTDVAMTIVRAATANKVSATVLFVPVSQQKEFAGLTGLPLAMEGAIKESRALATCVTDLTECMDFRVLVMKESQEHRKKVGHMPGITVQMLAGAVRVDYDEMAVRCERLSRALARGRKARLLSKDRDGTPLCLEMDLGGWSRMPVESTGVISDGAWGNIPGAETYIAPIEGSGGGEIYINGSLHSYPFPEGAGIRLAFKDGLLAGYVPSDGKAAEVIGHEKAVAESRGDTNWRNLAELGIGVNPNVGPLTGISILDEKKYGTAHIAIGSSDRFGGKVRSSIHSDMIVVNPDLIIDGHAVLERGESVLNPSDWEETLNAVAVDQAWADSFSSVAHSGMTAKVRGGSLFLEWNSGSGRLGFMRVGDLEASRFCARVYSRVPLGKSTTRAMLVKRTKLDPETVLKTLRVLKNYELVELT
jgi:leucyl aminopeptidase (aminopeptidase T)